MQKLPSDVVALWCWYHGGPFKGYQVQPARPTVQDTLQRALRAAGFERNPVPAGRTDAGVHARMQVLMLRVPHGTPPQDVTTRLNAQLPPSVGIRLTRQAPRKFHPQWKCAGKEYRYRLAVRDAPGWEQAAWRVDVEPERVHALLARAVGTRDFWAFHEKSSQRMDRTLRAVELARLSDALYELRLSGDGFARYMVRYLVGDAVGVARGELREADYQAALEGAVSFAGHRAPSHGLCLWDVRYPEELDPFTSADRAGPGALPDTPPFREGP